MLQFNIFHKKLHNNNEANYVNSKSARRNELKLFVGNNDFYGVY